MRLSGFGGVPVISATTGSTKNRTVVQGKSETLSKNNQSKKGLEAWLEWQSTCLPSTINTNTAKLFKMYF
jgi:hypothetical protein